MVTRRYSYVKFRKDLTIHHDKLVALAKIDAMQIF